MNKRMENGAAAAEHHSTNNEIELGTVKQTQWQPASASSLDVADDFNNEPINPEGSSYSYTAVDDSCTVPKPYPDDYYDTNTDNTNNHSNNDVDDGDDLLTTESADIVVQTWRHMTVMQLVGLSAFSFPYGMIISALAAIVLPLEAFHLRPFSHALWLGILTAASGLTQFSAPMVGLLSDRASSRLGRRTPFILVGTLFSIIWFMMMFVAHEIVNRYLYVVALFFAILSLTVAYIAYSGLVPDMVGPSQMGFVSGVSAVLTMLGSMVGFSLFGFFVDLKWAYVTFSLALVVGAFFTTWYAYPEPSAVLRNTNTSEQPPKLTLKVLLGAYIITPKKHSDFFWVWVSRVFYYMAVSIQIFIVFFLADMLKEDLKIARAYTCVLAIISQFAAAIIAVPAAKVSDRIGRRPLIYVACVVMAITYFGLLVTRHIALLCAGAVFYGIGNGIYLSADFALATDVIPSKQNAAKDLALWGIAALIGAMIGPAIGGPVLYGLGHQPENPEHYSVNGYVGLMILGAIYVTGSGFFISLVRRAK